MTSKPIPPAGIKSQRRVILFLTAFCIAVPPVSAQQDSTRAGCVPHGRISRIVEIPPRPVYAILEAGDDTSQTMRMYLATLLQEIARVFVPPDSIPPVFAYAFTARLHKDGRLTNAQPSESHIPLELAEATIRAVDSASRLGGIGPTFFELKKDPLPVQILFRLHDRQSELEVPFYQLRLPAFLEHETDQPALVLPGSPAPKYPEDLRWANIEGELLVQFVVDTLGRADMRAFRLLGPRQVYREFLQAVLDVLPRMRFSPALYRGCKVKQMVQLPFAFKLNR